jgi:hypothetical protein
VHDAQPSETNEYSILAGKALGKYMLGKYTRNASAEITGLHTWEQITKILANNWVGVVVAQTNEKYFCQPELKCGTKQLYQYQYFINISKICKIQACSLGTGRRTQRLLSIFGPKCL